MADFNIDDASFSEVLIELNENLTALAQANASDNPPSTISAGTLWADTSSDRMRQRNALNTAWLNLWSLSTGIEAGGGDGAGGAAVSGQGHAWAISLSEPTHPAEGGGDGWWNPDTSVLKIYNGTTWEMVGLPLGQGIPRAGVANDIIEKVDGTDFNIRWTSRTLSQDDSVQHVYHNFVLQDSGYKDTTQIEGSNWTNLKKSSTENLETAAMPIKSLSELWYIRSAGVYYFGSGSPKHVEVETKYQYCLSDTDGDEASWGTWADVEPGTIENNIALRLKVVSGNDAGNGARDLQPYVENPLLCSNAFPRATAGQFIKFKMLTQIPSSTASWITVRYGFYLDVNVISTKTVVSQVSDASETGKGAVLISNATDNLEGTNNAKAVSPSGVRSMFENAFFTSSEYNFVADTPVTASHNLGYLPATYRAVLVCKVAQGGYSVGTELDITMKRSANGGSLSADASSLYAQVGDEFYAKNGSNMTINASSWRWKFYAW